MVRQFNLVNEKNDKFSLMDIYKHCLLTEPNGLGYSYSTDYQQIDNIFIQDLRRIEQGEIQGTVNFINYDNYWAFVNFIEGAEKLRFEYIIPFSSQPQVFYRDVQISSLSKTEIQPNSVLSESIIFKCLGLWYQQDVTDYTFGEQDIVWDFRWNPYFADYKSRVIAFNNDGHTDAPFQVKMSGYIEKPKIQVIVDDKVINQIAFNFNLQNGESIEYSSKEGDIYIRKVASNGTVTNMFNSSYIDLNNTNIFTLPKGESLLTVSADTEIFNGNVAIFKRYKIV